MYLDNQDNLIYSISKEDYEERHKYDEDLNFIGVPFYIDKIGLCRILVNKYGGMTPHFELYSIDNPQIKTCISLSKPEYYFRGKNNYIKLNSIQIDNLISFLKDKNVIGNGVIPIMQFVVTAWDYLNNGKKYYSFIDNIDSYSKLKEE